MSCRIRTGRAFHAIDIENLLGGPTDDVGRIRAAWAAYSTLVVPGDAVVMGGSGYTVKHAAFELPRSIRWVTRVGGKDAADLALLVDAFDPDHVAKRYEWLVVGSADHLFALAAVEAKLRGMHVWSISGLGKGTAVARVADVHSRLRLSTHALPSELTLAA